MQVLTVFQIFSDRIKNHYGTKYLQNNDSKTASKICRSFFLSLGGNYENIMCPNKNFNFNFKCTNISYKYINFRGNMIFIAFSTNINTMFLTTSCKTIKTKN